MGKGKYFFKLNYLLIILTIIFLGSIGCSLDKQKTPEEIIGKVVGLSILKDSVSSVYNSQVVVVDSLGNRYEASISIKNSRNIIEKLTQNYSEGPVYARLLQNKKNPNIYEVFELSSMVFVNDSLVYCIFQSNNQIIGYGE